MQLDMTRARPITESLWPCVSLPSGDGANGNKKDMELIVMQHTQGGESTLDVPHLRTTDSKHSEANRQLPIHK